MTWGQYNFPFAQNPSSAVPQTINYDLVIDEDYPGICFVPEVPGGIYCEIRVVGTCLWIVTNAMWNPNTQQWEQDSPANPALPAYALEQCDDGSLRRLIAPATNAINSAVVWETVLESDAQGDFSITPATLDAAAQIAEQVNPTWNAGAAVMIARAVNVTDTASGAESALDQLSVGGVVKWKVRKDGYLEVGSVPASAIVGGIVQSLIAGTGIAVTNNGNNTWTVALAHGDYVDLPNAQTITGVKTIADATSLLLGNASGAEGSLVGSSAAAMTAWGYGATFAASPFTWKANAVSACIVRIDPTNGFEFYHDTGLVVGNTYAPTLIFRIDDTGTIVTGTGITPSEIAADLEGKGGIQVAYDGGTNKVSIDGSAFVTALSSPDGTILVGGTTQQPTIEVASNVYPVGGTKTVQGNGGSPTITLPGSAAETWELLIIQGFQQTNNVNATITNTATNISNFGTTADGNTAFNAVAWITIVSNGQATGGVTASVTTSVTSGSFANSPAQPWTIIATRTA